MQSSPCRECDLKDQDKRNPTCEACPARKTYVKDLGGLSESVPVEMTDMRSKKPRMMMRWDDSCIDFIRANIDTMANKQLAVHFGVSASAIASQLSIRGIKRNGESRRKEIIPDIKYPPPPLKEETPPGASKRYFVVDFSKYGDLYDRFLTFSKENFRTGDNQILYLISQALKEKELI